MDLGAARSQEAALQGRTHIRAWKSADALDDQAPLSTLARVSLACGRWLMAHGLGQPIKEEPFEDKFGDFLRLSPEIQRCRGMTVVDIGGGSGQLAAHLAARGARYVWCVEPDPDLAARARETLAGHDNAQAVQALGQEVRDIIGGADRVILHEVMQHVDKPDDLLTEVHDLLTPSGLAFVMFTPWGSPWGAHTRELLPVPWLHLLYPKSVLAEMRSSESGWHSRDLSATGLYKLGAGEFLTLVEHAGLEVARLQLLPVWRQQWMTRWPLLWELGSARLGVVLKNPT
jgi:SAM-dependent methyltransferase